MLQLHLLEQSVNVEWIKFWTQGGRKSGNTLAKILTNIVLFRKLATQTLKWASYDDMQLISPVARTRENKNVLSLMRYTCFFFISISWLNYGKNLSVC